MLTCLKLFYTFLKLGFISFGGGYAMLSLIMTESYKFGITTVQFADLNALDMVVPGAIAINASTYVGYLAEGFPGAVAATIGVSVPSFVLAVLVMRFFAHFKDSVWLNDTMSGIKPAAVGLIAAAAATIAGGVLTLPDQSVGNFFTNPLGTFSLVCVAIFALTAVINIRFKVSPILLTVLAGIAGAFLVR